MAPDWVIGEASAVGDRADQLSAPTALLRSRVAPSMSDAAPASASAGARLDGGGVPPDVPPLEGPLFAARSEDCMPGGEELSAGGSRLPLSLVLVLPPSTGGASLRARPKSMTRT